VTTFIGLDLSLRASGVAVWRGDRDGGSVFRRTIRTAPVEDAHGWAAASRHRRIAAEVLSYVEVGDTLAIVEQRINYADGSRHGTTELDLSALRAVVVAYLAGRRVPVASAYPVQVKAYLTGSGRASKPDMVAAAVRLLRQQPADDNQADALGLLAMGLDRWGRPLAPLPARNRAVLDRITWPVFTPTWTLATVGDQKREDGT
jgi:Holliday junction resolvasome RuvABC endonuclease subunit